MSSETDGRRKALAEGVAYALNAYLQAGRVLNPSELAASALRGGESASDQGGQQFDRQEDVLRAMGSQIQNLMATYEGGRLVVYLDRKTALELIERMLKKSFARQEAAATAMFRIDLGPYMEKDHDGELVLPTRSIYVKFVPAGRLAAEFAASYVERARSRNPSEYWLLAPSEAGIDIPFDPIFTEGKITRGRLRTFGLANLITDIVGKDRDVIAAYDGDKGFMFVISKRPTVPPTA